MRKSTPKTRQSPRREATPLLYSGLTQDQRRAGLEIASALRAMADEPWSPLPGTPEEHAYLPKLDRSRTNRVLLIDGERGTGKSALLLTLLNVYRRHVLGKPAPRGFEGMAELIIPVGLLDLQPLPPSTNLALHVLGQLKGVVDAVEPPTAGTSGKPLWEEPTSNRLRDRWTRLMRLLASWDESLEARIGSQDASSYIVEIVEEELERGQLSEGFRGAVDALVEGYAAKRGWDSDKRPMFLIAIDDADMNPRLSSRLLELLRKLWHPRLVFLLAGHSELFLLRLKEAVLAQGSRASKGGAKYLRLAQDMYDKDIPSSARFPLGALRPDERVERNREIHSLLQRFSVDAHPPEIPRKEPHTPLSLRDYFLAHPQSSELLPERLRQVDELMARLRRESPRGEGLIPPPDTFRMVKWLWDVTVKEHVKNEKRREQLLGALTSAQLDGQLRLNTDRIRLRAELEPIGRMRQENSEYTFTMQEMSRFRALLKPELSTNVFGDLQSGNNESLPAPVTACWLLASDIAGDSRQEGPHDLPKGAVDEGSVRFVMVSRQESNLEPALEVPWPLPAWPAPLDYKLFSKYWKELLATMPSRGGPDTGLLARHYLSLVIQLSHGRVREESMTWGRAPTWPDLADAFVKLTMFPRPLTPREQEIAEWAGSDAILLGAPESGLPPEEAGMLLDAFAPVVGPSWSAERIQERRRTRLAAVPSLNRQNLEPERALSRVDGANPTHPFVVALEGTYKPSHRQGNRRSLLEEFEYLIPPPHSGIFKSKDFKLGQYRTSLRQDALENLPDPLHGRLRASIEQLRGRSAPVALINLWKTLANQSGRPDVASWFSLDRTRLSLSEDAGKYGRRRRDAVLSSRGGLTLSIHADRVRELVIESFAPATLASELPLPLEAIFRLIFDYIQDQEDDSLPPETGFSVWPRVAMRLSIKASQPIHPWPDVCWPSLKEYEDAPGPWAERVASLEDWVAHDVNAFKPYAVDAFALSYLEDRQASYRRGHAGPTIKGDVTLTEVSEFLTQLKSSSASTTGRRSKLLAQWVEQLPLMGTPEAGLSDDVARLFLSPKFAGGLTPGQLQSMRRERTLADGVPRQEVDDLLSAVDEKFPNHPWVEHTTKPSKK